MRVVLFIAAMVLPCMCIDETSLRLPVSEQAINPSQRDTKDQLMHLLGVRKMDVQTLESNTGRNGGMWVLSSPSWNTGDLILKYRAADPAEPFPEAVQLKHLARMHPGLEQDPHLAFPSMIIAGLGRAGFKQGDFIVSRKVPGHMLAELISIKYAAGDAGKKELSTIFEKVGQQLRAFHGRYGKQHADFHGANVLVDVANDNRITFVDLSGIGQYGDDVSHFKESLQLLSQFYKPASFLSDCFEQFRRGYDRTLDLRMTRSSPGLESSQQKMLAPEFQYERQVPETWLGGNTHGLEASKQKMYETGQQAPTQKIFATRDLHRGYDRTIASGTRSNLVRESPQQKKFAPIRQETAAQKMWAQVQDNAVVFKDRSQTRKSCSSHSRCRHLSGDCCPLYGDKYMSCCDPESVPEANAPVAQRNLAKVFAAAPPAAAYEPRSVSLPSWSTPPTYAASGVQQVRNPTGRASPPSRGVREPPPGFR